MSDYHEIFDKIPDGVLLHEAGSGAIVESNEQFCAMLGYSHDELLELKFEEIHLNEPPYTAERAETLIQQAARDEPLNFEWVTKTKGGEPLPVEVHLRETTIDGEERVLAVVRDITDRQRRQHELERQNQRLEKFASMVSHDLRNPLTVAQGRLELAREECDNEHLSIVSRAHERMESLIRNMLTLAREGSKAMEVRPVELAARARMAWTNVESGGATLVVEGERSVRADPSRLDQLFENLFRNAVEHGPTSSHASHDDAVEHGPTNNRTPSDHAVEHAGDAVTVTVGLTDDGFYVEDDGHGIPKEHRENAFSPGYTTTDGGTGIGLSIVEDIVTAHDWVIRLTESESGGARFEISDVEFVS